MEFFITRPEHDEATFYLSAWSKELIEMARGKGIQVFDFNKSRANATETAKLLTKKKPGLVMFNGHGGKYTIMGHKNEVLIEYGKNERLIRDKIVYCRSCNSAAGLGKKSIKSGVVAFLGYKDLFGFPLDPQRAAHPLRDKFARPCLEASNQAVKSLLKGNTVKEAHDSAQAVFRAWIEKMQRSDAPQKPLIFCSGPCGTWSTKNFMGMEMQNFTNHGINCSMFQSKREVSICGD